MGSRHRRSATVPNRVAVRLSAGAAAVALGALGVADLVSSEEPPPQPFSQDARLVAVSPTSVTAVSPDGSAMTYLVTAETTSVTIGGGQIGAANLPFDVNDEVLIVGEVRDGTPVATAVAARSVAELNGPPMDSVSP